MAEYLSHSEEETSKIASDFVKRLSLGADGSTVVGLYGELGVGKSVFTRGLAETLGVREKIQSPTFVIMKIYDLPHSDFRRLVHIDAYRLDNEKELEILGWKDILADRTNLIFVEWADKVSGIMPKNFIKINFEHVSDNERRIKVEILQGPTL